jgi:hypothetical protein
MNGSWSTPPLTCTKTISSLSGFWTANTSVLSNDIHGFASKRSLAFRTSVGYIELSNCVNGIIPSDS